MESGRDDAVPAPQANGTSNSGFVTRRRWHGCSESSVSPSAGYSSVAMMGLPPDGYEAPSARPWMAQLRNPKGAGDECVFQRPKRLTPGWEHVLSTRAMLGAVAGLALGLAGGALLSRSLREQSGAR